MGLNFKEERDRIRAECAEQGIFWAKDTLSQRTGEQAFFARQWIDEYEQQESTAERTVQRELMIASIEAARDAARSSKRSAFWTMVAAIVAAIGALATAAGSAVPVMQALGWLPK